MSDPLAPYLQDYLAGSTRRHRSSEGESRSTGDKGVNKLRRHRRAETARETKPWRVQQEGLLAVRESLMNILANLFQSLSPFSCRRGEASSPFFDSSLVAGA